MYCEGHGFCLRSCPFFNCNPIFAGLMIRSLWIARWFKLRGIGCEGEGQDDDLASEIVLYFITDVVVTDAVILTGAL